MAVGTFPGAMNLADAVDLVAGASEDFGRAVSFDLLAAGADVFMLGRSMARPIRASPPENVRERCHFIVADLADGDAITRIKTELGSRGRWRARGAVGMRMAPKPRSQSEWITNLEAYSSETDGI